MLNRRQFIGTSVAGLFLPRAGQAFAADWSGTEAEAKGQTVYFKNSSTAASRKNAAFPASAIPSPMRSAAAPTKYGAPALTSHPK